MTHLNQVRRHFLFFFAEMIEAAASWVSFLRQTPPHPRGEVQARSSARNRVNASTGTCSDQIHGFSSTKMICLSSEIKEAVSAKSRVSQLHLIFISRCCDQGTRRVNGPAFALEIKDGSGMLNSYLAANGRSWELLFNVANYVNRSSEIPYSFKLPLARENLTAEDLHELVPRRGAVQYSTYLPSRRAVFDDFESQ